MGIRLSQADMDFIWAQLTLPNNDPRNAPFGTILDPAGIRDVSGLGNNVNNPHFGNTDQLFVRLTPMQFDQAEGSFTLGPHGIRIVPVPVSYATRDVNLVDSSARTISNIVADQSDAALIALGYLTPEARRLAVLDDPSSTPGGRILPITLDALNALPYSSITTIFGQFFDHGLDLLHKGADGLIVIPLLPGDPLYDHPDNAIYAGNPPVVVGYKNYILAERSNTIHVDVDQSSTDTLVAALGLTEDRYVAGDPGATAGRVVGVSEISSAIIQGGVLILNNVAITINPGATRSDVIGAINAQTTSTGIDAFIDGQGRLVLNYAVNQSVNTTSPFVDLSQSYGSVASHTAFIREYQEINGRFDITGRLLSGGLDKDVDGRADGMATWKSTVQNAGVVNVILHDKDVADIPLVRMTATGMPFLDASGMWLVARDKVSGEVYFIQDSFVAANTRAMKLEADGSTVEVIGSAFDAIKSQLILQTTGHAFLDDIAHGVLRTIDPTTGDLSADSTAARALLDAHLISGDGRTNENLALSMIHDVFHTEHNSTVADLKARMTLNADGTYTEIATARIWSGEDIFQAAKLVSEMQYQHLVFGEFVRKLSPNINLFAGYDITIDPSISAEFAHAVYRFGHSMLTETVAMTGYDPVTGISNGEDNSMGLIEAFLNPAAYTPSTSGEVAIGMSGQVGNAIDEWVTDALRNNLVGLPLDLATLNLVRGRDAGLGSLNEVRASLFAQTGITSLKPYENWDDFAANLLHHESLENFIMAYARDVVIDTYGDLNASLGGIQRPVDGLAGWDALRDSADASSRELYATALRDAARAAIDDVAFMTSDFGLNSIDFWIGGLAEKKVPGGMLGATFDFIFAMQMIKLQNADRFYYLARLAGTDLLGEIEGQLFSDIVMRATGVKHLYSDIFSVPDKFVEIGSPGTAAETYGSLNSLLRSTTAVPDAEGRTVKIGNAGWVGSNETSWTFYGNPGEYLDARGVFSPNNTASLKGNASEMIGGTDAAERIHAQGGNDTVWADGGNDTVEGGEGNDFLHGGDGDDVITDAEGNDLIWGDDGNDVINAGSGSDQVFGGEGNDLLYGALGLDAVDGGGGNDVIYGDSGAISIVNVNGNPVEVMDVNGDADVLAGGLGNDTLFGGGGADLIDGGEGDDVLYGGIGDDLMSGGFGSDRFVMDASDIGFLNSMDGGMDHDIVDYSASIGVGSGTGVNRLGIDIDLNPIAPALAPVPAPPAPDLFLSIEEVIGSRFNDSIRGGANLPLQLGTLNDEFGIEINFGTVEFPLFRTGTVTIDGGLGNDTIEGGDGTGLWLTQADGSYAYEGWALNADAVTYTYVGGLWGGDTWDPTTAGPGMDYLVGGEGIDTISYRSASSTATTAIDIIGPPEPNLTGITVDLSIVEAQNTINAGWDLLSGFENVLGSSFDDTITGNNGDNVLDGGVGDDSINGGAGNDTLIGGLGDDLLQGGAGNNTVSYADTNSTALIPNPNGATPGITGVTVNLSLATEQNTINSGLDTLTGIQNAVGSIFNDTLSGGLDNVLVDNLLDGNAGNDTLTGGGGNDTLIGGLGDDSLNGGAGTDTASYAGSSAAIVANISNGTLTALGLTVTTNRAAGGAGLDVLTSIENLTGGDAGDALLGSAGNNVLDGGLGNDSLDGGAGDDTLIGGSGNDTLNGGAGNDVLRGGVGNDTLIDTAGTNTMEGGEGDDVYTVLTGSTLVELANGGVDTVRTTSASFTLANNIENLVFTNGTSFVGTGNALANSITGGNAADTLIGGEGDDTLAGGLGNDRLDGGVGSDTASYVGISTAVTVNLSTQTVNTVLAGQAVGAGTDTLVSIENAIGGSANDLLVGSDQDNRLDGGVGNDTLQGGLGNDTYIVDSQTDVVLELLNQGTDTVRTNLASYLTLADNVENLVFTGVGNFTGGGNSLSNLLQGGTGDDTLSGGDGNDTLDGGAGDDAMAGGTGNDVYRVNSLRDRVTEQANQGTDTVETSLSSYELGAAVENLVYTGPINFYGVGNSLNNVITGAAGDDTLVGGLGNDVLQGGEGSDLADYSTATGAVTVNLTLGTVSGNQGNDSLVSIERIIGGSGDDIFIGNDADNLLNGGKGGDTMRGGLGNDTYVVDSQLDVIEELPDGGNDTVITSMGEYTLGADNIENLEFYGNLTHRGFGSNQANRMVGGDYNDMLDGAEGNDTLTGGLGNDSLYGGLGDDLLYDGQGFNVLAGGEGNDTYVVTDKRVDRVVEYSAEGIDTVRVSLTNYTLDAQVENLVYTGTSSLIGFSGIGNELDNQITGGVASDDLQGGDGNDTLIGGLGDDALNGGIGFDTASYATATSAVTVNLLTGAVSRGAGADRLTSIESIIGSGFDDSLTGDAGNNVIEGGGGNDTLIGGAGSDTVSYAGANAGVTVTLANQFTNIIFSGLVSQNTQGAGSDRLSGFENLTGSRFADNLTGSTGANVLDGGSGNDQINGGDGNDQLLGQGGSDTLIGGAGNDTLDGGAGTDTVSFAGSTAVTVDLGLGRATGVGTDTLLGIENAIGSSADDLFIGDAANNRFDGGDGFDTASYAAATSGININFELGQSSGGGGSDQLISIESIVGSLHADTLIGGSGADRFDGSGGDDSISGGAGNDTLTGGSGSNTVLGGDGIDTLSYSGAGVGVTVSLATTGAQVTGWSTDDVSSIENLIGSAFDDTLTGDLNANQLNGAAGDDTLHGGAGNDTLIGGLGNDRLEGDEGIDIASYADSATAVTVNFDTATVTGQGSDTLVSIEHILGSALADSISGGADDLLLNQILDGNAGNDTISGGGGDDVLIGGLGNDALNGGAGIDTASYSAASAAVVVNLTTGTATGGAGTDTLTQIENLIGSNFNDTLTGGLGQNALSGGLGNDTYVVDTASDQVIELAGQGTDTVQTALAAWTLSDAVENLSYTGSTAFTGVGNELNNLLSAGAGDQNLSGLAGDDTLVGGAGNDTLNGGDGVDTANYSAITTAIAVNLNTGLATGGGGADTLIGIENIIAGSAADTLTGNASDNFLDGGAGTDTMQGGDGNDTYVVSVATDVVTENLNQGTDTVITALASYTIAANVENLIGTRNGQLLGTTFTATGNALNNLIIGTSGADNLQGGDGNDTLVGGGTNALNNILSAADTLNGGAGNDTVTFEGLTAGVQVTLANQTSNQNVTNGIIRLQSIENLLGSAFDDRLSGDANANVINGGGGNDTLVGGLGADTLTGGAGVDTADYSSATATVNLSLRTGLANGNQGADVLSEIEILIGGSANDTLEGDAFDNLLDGGLGNDTFIVSAGNDTIVGGGGTDLVVLSGAIEDYTFVIDRVSGQLVVRGTAGNSSTLIQVEQVQFLAGNAGTVAVANLPMTDIAPARVTAFSASSPSGLFKAGEAITLTATMNEAVQAGSEMRVVLDTGGEAILRANAQGTGLVGTYTVGAGETTELLTIVAYANSGNGVKDVAGNTMDEFAMPAINLPDSREIQIDTTAPTVLMFSSTAPNGSYGAGDTLIITATLSELVVAGAAIEVTLNTGDTITLKAGTASNVLRGTFVIGAGDTAENLEVVSYSPSASALDFAGNVVTPGANQVITLESADPANIPATRSLVIDTIKPNQPIITAVIDDTSPGLGELVDMVTNDRRPTLSISAEAGAVVDVYNVGRYIGSATQQEGEAVDGMVNYRFTPAYALGEGNYQLTVRAVDAAGNVSDPSQPLALTIDFTAPVAPKVNFQTTPSSDPTVTGLAALKVGETLTVSFGEVSYSARVDARPSVDNENGVIVYTTSVDPAPSPLPFSVDLALNSWALQLANLVEGSYSIGAKIVDQAGNQSLDNTSDELIINTSAPQVLGFRTVTLDGSYGIGQTISIIADMSEVVKAGGKIEVTLSNQVILELTTLGAGPSQTLRGVYTVQENDLNTLDLGVESYSAVDGSQPENLAGTKMALQFPMPESGIISDQSAIEIDTDAPDAPAITAILDNVDPVVGNISLAVAQGNTNDNTPTFTITAETGTTVRIYSGSENAPVFVGLAEETSTPGEYQLTLDSNLDDGNYVFYAVSTDNAGNNSNWSTPSEQIVIDTVAPLVPTLQSQMGTDTTPVVTGWVTLRTGESFVVTIDGIEYPGVDGNGMEIQTADGVTTWNLQLPDMGMNGVFDVAVMVRDLAGNTRADESTSELVIDNIAPTIVAFASSTVDGAYKAGAEIGITATLSEAVREGAQITVMLNTNTEVTLTANLDGMSLSGIYTVVDGENAADLSVVSYRLGNGATPVNDPIDLAGNAMTSVALPNNLADTRAIVVDTLAPELPILTVTDNSIPAAVETVAQNGFTNDATPTLRILTEAGSTVTIFESDFFVGNAQEIAPGTFTYTPTLGQGSYSYTAQSTDRAGNTSISTAAAFTVDTITPTSSSLAIAFVGSTPFLTGNAVLGLNDALEINIAGTIISSATPDAGLTWQGSQWTLAWPVALDQAGSRLVSASVVDLAGNRSAAATVTVQNGTDLAQTLTGAATADYIRAHGGNDTVNGNAGNDRLDGGIGNDTLNGGGGNDTLTGGLGNDRLDGNGGTDTVSYETALAGVVVNLNTNGAQNTVGNGTDTLISIENLLGSAFNDILTGNGNSNTIFGGAGNDTITGGGAADTLNGGEGSDLYILASTGDFPAAEVISDSGQGLLDVDEVRFTTTGNNSTFTLGSSFSGIERAVIGTGIGAQAVTTGTTTININATALNVGLTMIGNNGVNTLTGSAAGDSMEGGGGNDNLIGNGGDDSLLGGIGNDSLQGGVGQDILVGGLGADTLNGGVGSDTLRFAAGDTGQTTATRDTIQGFELGAIGVGDVIDYAAALQIGGSNALASATQASINQLTGVATFAAGSGTTLADALADIAGRFTAAGNASGEFAFFRINNAGNINLFVSDGVAGVGANDVLVELVGITTVGSIALNNGDLMLL